MLHEIGVQQSGNQRLAVGDPLYQRGGIFVGDRKRIIRAFFVNLRFDYKRPLFGRDRFGNRHVADVSTAKRFDLFQTECDEIAQITQHHVEKTVFVYGVIAELLRHVQFIGNELIGLLFGHVRDHFAVLGEMLDGILGNALHLFDRHDFAVRANELTFFPHRLFDEFQPFLDRFDPIRFDMAKIFGCLKFIAVGIGLRDRVPVLLTGSAVRRLFPVFLERAIINIEDIHTSLCPFRIFA